MPFVSSIRGVFGPQGKVRNRLYALDGAVSGGNEVIRVSNTIYHIFTTTGNQNFIALAPITNASILSIGGGGGGGTHHGGGGGGSEIDLFSSYSLSASTYNVFVGNGGQGLTGDTAAGGNTGATSGVTGIITSLGGGGGGTNQNAAGKTGGSGGGAANSNQQNAAGSGANTNSGGTAISHPIGIGNLWSGGGGGGATGSGGNASQNPGQVFGGNGGQGYLISSIDSNLSSTSSFSGMTRVSSGGGGCQGDYGGSRAQPSGGVGGTGAGDGESGGGFTRSVSSATSFGSGGGAGLGSGSPSGSGRSGVVVIKYPV